MAGKPSYRELAKQTGMSHTTARTVILCERLPRWGALELIAEALGARTEEFHRLWLTADAAITAPIAGTPATPSGPAAPTPHDIGSTTPHHEISGTGAQGRHLPADQPPSEARSTAAEAKTAGQSLPGAGPVPAITHAQTNPAAQEIAAADTGTTPTHAQTVPAVVGQESTAPTPPDARTIPTATARETTIAEKVPSAPHIQTTPAAAAQETAAETALTPPHAQTTPAAAAQETAAKTVPAGTHTQTTPAPSTQEITAAETAPSAPHTQTIPPAAAQKIPAAETALAPPHAQTIPAAAAQEIGDWGAATPDQASHAKSDVARSSGLSRRTLLISAALVAAAGAVLVPRLWSGEPGPREGTLFGGPLSGEHGAVWSVSCGFLGERPVVLFGCQDGTVHLRDFVTGERIGGVLTGHDRAVFAVKVATPPGGPTIGVTAGADGTVRVWDLASGQGRVLNAGQETGGINALALGLIGTHLVAYSAGDDGTIRQWDVASATPEHRVLGEPLALPPKAIAFDLVGGVPVLLSGGDDRLVRRWSPLDAKPTGVPLGGHDGTIWNLTMGRADGKAVALSAGEDGTARLWDLTAEQPLGHLLGERLPNPVKCVALADVGGTTIGFSGADDGTLREWNLTTSKQVGPPLGGPSTGPEGMEVAHLNGRTHLFAGTWDGSVWTWDLGPTA